MITPVHTLQRIGISKLIKGTSTRYHCAEERHLLEKLDLCQCPHVSNNGLIAIVVNCRNLTVLSIESCPKIGIEGLQAIEKLCPKLQSISIKDCPLIGDHGVSRLLLSASFVLLKVKLHGLSIANFSLAVIGHYGKCCFVFGDGLVAFAKFVGSLECLQLECNMVTQFGVIGVLSNQNPCFP
ncbi:hypothetical protein J1N35_034828 [Gossypium stocksii]|uniref:COI1 F-box domain-containing protein n=1 Tax=Gossypium stocksii TaxID=47602 RepID=A0A9D3USR9_9ROSI|nr:hypothetical protein J1N35_034828 [Gossypium stocksii]